MSFNADDVRAALKDVQEPDLKRDLVELGMIKDIECADGRVSLTIELTTPACPLKAEIGDSVKQAIKALKQLISVGLVGRGETQFVVI